MESETIDLTTPIPQVLKKTNRTEENHSNNPAQTKLDESNVQNLQIFLLNADESNTSNKAESKETDETIVLSDDDETSDNSAKNSGEVTEVNVIELIGDSGSSSNDKNNTHEESVNKANQSEDAASKDISYNELPCSIIKVNQTQGISVDLTGSDSEGENTCKAPFLTPIYAQDESIKKTELNILKTIRAIDYLKESSEPINVESNFEGIHATITPIIMTPKMSMPKIVDIRSVNTHECSAENMGETVKNHQSSSESNYFDLNVIEVSDKVKDCSDSLQTYAKSSEIINKDDVVTKTLFGTEIRGPNFTITDETLEVQKVTTVDASITNASGSSSFKKDTETRNFIFDKNVSNAANLIQIDLTDDQCLIGFMPNETNDTAPLDINTTLDIKTNSTEFQIDEDTRNDGFTVITTNTGSHASKVENIVENSNTKDSFYFDNSGDTSFDVITTNVKIAVESILEDTNTPLIGETAKIYQRFLDSEVIEISDEPNVLEAKLAGSLLKPRQDANSSLEGNETVKAGNTIASLTPFGFINSNNNNLQAVEGETSQSEQIPVSLEENTALVAVSAENLSVNSNVNDLQSLNSENDSEPKDTNFNFKFGNNPELAIKGSNTDLDIDDQAPVSSVEENSTTVTSSGNELKITSSEPQNEEISDKCDNIASTNIPAISNEVRTLRSKSEVKKEENSTSFSGNTCSLDPNAMNQSLIGDQIYNIQSSANKVTHQKSEEKSKSEDSTIATSSLQVSSDMESSNGISLDNQKSSVNQFLETKVPESEIGSETNLDEKCETFLDANDILMIPGGENLDAAVTVDMETKNTENVVEVREEDKIETTQGDQLDSDVEVLEDNTNNTNLPLGDIEVNSYSIRELNGPSDSVQIDSEKSEEHAKEAIAEENNEFSQEQSRAEQELEILREISDSSSDDVFEEIYGSKSLQGISASLQGKESLPDSKKTTMQEVLAEQQFHSAFRNSSSEADIKPSLVDQVCEESEISTLSFVENEAIEMTQEQNEVESSKVEQDSVTLNDISDITLNIEKKFIENDSSKCKKTEQLNFLNSFTGNEVTVKDTISVGLNDSEETSKDKSLPVCENVESGGLERNSDYIKSELCPVVDQESREFKEAGSAEIKLNAEEVKKDVGENIVKDPSLVDSQKIEIINENEPSDLDKLKNTVKLQLTNLKTNKKIGIIHPVSPNLLNANKKNVKYLMVKRSPIGKMILTKLSKPLNKEKEVIQQPSLVESKNDQEIKCEPTSISPQQEKTTTDSDLKFVKPETSDEFQDPDQTEPSEESATEAEINPFGVKSASLSLEDVRKNLKMQLTSLRMRKKMNILHNVKQTINDDSLYNQKLHEVSVGSSSSSHNVITEPIKKSPAVYAKVNPETPTTVSRENTESPHQENEDLPNVFNEIRKIIRKQKSLPAESFTSKALSSTFKPTLSTSDNSNDSLLEAPSKNSKNTAMPKSLSATNIENSSESKGSPFVSNSLDEFLTDSKLNVSYAIPKSGAEEGLRENNYNDPIMLVDHQVKSEESTDKPKEKTAYKPKTLAEKRKMFERNKKIEEKRLNKLKYLEERQKGSYVLFKNEKVFVKSRTTGKCLSAVESTISKADLEPSEQQSSPSKPSLLQEYYRKTTKLKFMPGPLSKKHLLQSDYSEWRSELRSLPKCVVELLPQFGKPVHPNLLPHVLNQWNPEISDDHLEFALAALDDQTKQEQRKTFKFNVNYDRGQDKILCRKKIGSHLDVKPSKPVEDDIKGSVQVYESEVAKVIDDLIKYVEIKELAPSLIKDDADAAPLSDPVAIAPDTTEPKTTIKKKQPRRLACTNRELLRLNCKVISVDVKQTEPKVKCSKPYCQLGCVCESLNCPTIIGAHCRKTKCLFLCTCPKSKNRVINITLPSNNGELLSADAVTRIEDEAKRNLAREEKEFTQTVIYSQEGALVVGSGYKSRRITKTPRKYTEFFEDVDDIVEGPKKSYSAVKPCSVDLDRHNFSSIIPYCLVHHLYDCHCEGYSRLFPKSSKPRTTDGSCKKEPEFESRKRSFKKSNSISDEDFIKEGSSESFDSTTDRSNRKKKCTVKPDYVLWSSSGRSNKSRMSELTKPHTYLLGPDGCARVNEVAIMYLDSKPFSESATAGDFVNQLTESDFLKMKLNKKIDDKLENECDKLKKDLFEMKRALIIATNTSRAGHKRKQELKIRQYGNNDIQTNIERPSSVKSRVAPVFPGEIIVTDPLWLEKLSRNADRQHCLVGSYARILPWAALIQGFILKMVNIYCVYDMPLRLLLNVGPKLQGKHLLDIETNSSFILQTPLKGTAPWLIKQSENIRDIIKWLLTGALSPKYNPRTLSFLLVETAPGQFEVRGLCTQTQKIQETKTSELKSAKSETASTVFRKIAPKPDSATVINEDVSNEPTEVKHKNMRGEVVSLFISRQQYPLRELIEDGCDDDLTDNLYMWVSLPEVKKVAKWRVVFLNQDFVYLHFKNIDYSIKYNDLVKLTQIAKDENSTMLVKNTMLQRNHNHAEFGIYVSPKYSDRVFIGPYLLHYDEEDIDQLKYISKILVSAQSLNKMKGNDRYKSGHWMYESSYNQPPEVILKSGTSSAPKPPATTITSNCEAIPDVPAISTQVSEVSEVETSDEPVQIVKHNGFTVRIKTTKPRQPTDFNRYIITNIPHFGYLGAYQPDNSSVLEVSWPFERKVLEFDNADNARDFLQDRFNQLLQPVPETFKLQVIVLIHLDIKEHKPIRSDFLNGQCICSCYGAFHVKDLTEEFCLEKFYMSKSDITLMFAKRAQDYVMKKLQELAVISGMNVSNDESYNVSSILMQAQREIKRLESDRRTIMSEIHTIESSVVQKVTRVFEMIKKLPPKYRNIESRVLNETLQIRPQRVTASGVIEIIDDDKPTLNKTGTTKKTDTSVAKGTRQKRKIPACIPLRLAKLPKVTPIASKATVGISKMPITKETSQSSVNEIL